MASHNPYAGVPNAPADLDLDALSGDRAVELDVGFGRGHFVLERAACRPDTLLIGLEMRRKWVGLAIERAGSRQLDNVVAWYGDARHLLPGWGPDDALSAIFVNFPDPWWKKRHQKRLVVTNETVDHFVRLLKPKGQLLVQTDVQPRAEAYCALLAAREDLRPVDGGELRSIDGHPFEASSHREKKCLEANLPVYRYLLEKKG